jgi:hypothetical protein
METDADASMESSPQLSSLQQMSTAVTQRYALRSKVKITQQQMLQDMANLEEMERGDRTGGVGIPGGYAAESVRGFKSLAWNGTMSKELSSILRASADAHGQDVVEKRKLAGVHNRQIEFQQGQTGYFSLHVANDIAGIWNSPSRGARVYAYEDLTPKLKKRLAADSGHYFTGKMKSGERESMVAGGMQWLLAGHVENANKLFEQAGATKKGLKWINKFSTLMLSERGRELAAGIDDPAKGLTFAALEDIRTGKAGFMDKFMPKSKQVASFVGKGGAEEHRLHAAKIKN